MTTAMLVHQRNALQNRLIAAQTILNGGIRAPLFCRFDL